MYKILSKRRKYIKFDPRRKTKLTIQDTEIKKKKKKKRKRINSWGPKNSKGI